MLLQETDAMGNLTRQCYTIYMMGSGGTTAERKPNSKYQKH